jgi:hypothetical protein
VTVKVEVTDGYQLVDIDGEVHTSGTIEVDDAEAPSLIGFGWATEVKPSKAEPAKAEDAVAEEVDVSEYHTGGGWYDINGERVRGEQAARDALR